jgi:small subunit ribosomal protein S20
MPNTKSAFKNWKQSLKARARNRKVKTILKNELKEVRGAVAGGKVEEAAKEAVVAQTKLDRAASRKIIHRNKAARLKSRMSKLIKSAKAKK